MSVADDVYRILAAHRRGAMTEGEVAVRLLIAAGQGDDAAVVVFAQLPPVWRASIARDVAGVNAGEARIVESSCRSGPPEEYAADLRWREQAMRRGIEALRRVIAAPTEATSGPAFDPDDPWHVNANMLGGFNCQHCDAFLTWDDEMKRGHEAIADEFLRGCVAVSERARSTGWRMIDEYSFVCPACAARVGASRPSL